MACVFSRICKRKLRIVISFFLNFCVQKKCLLKKCKTSLKIIIIKLITNKDLLYSTGKSAQCYVTTWMGWIKGRWVHVYMYGCVTLLCT